VPAGAPGSRRTRCRATGPGIEQHGGHQRRPAVAAEPAADRYRDWLCASYDLVRAATPLLAEAMAECVRLGEPDLAAYFAGQITDEFGHDRWLAEDWAATGGDAATLTERVPSPAAAR
jgi:hypothetical protein